MLNDSNWLKTIAGLTLVFLPVTTTL